MIMAGQVCILEHALRRSAFCPQGRCPFWEEGSAVAEPGCVLGRLLPDDDWTPQLAARWLSVRRRIVEQSGQLEPAARRR